MGFLEGPMLPVYTAVICSFGVLLVTVTVGLLLFWLGLLSKVRPRPPKAVASYTLPPEIAASYTLEPRRDSSSKGPFST